eukprot:sb/3477584/
MAGAGGRSTGSSNHFRDVVREGEGKLEYKNVRGEGFDLNPGVIIRKYLEYSGYLDSFVKFDNVRVAQFPEQSRLSKQVPPHILVPYIIHVNYLNSDLYVRYVNWPLI